MDCPESIFEDEGSQTIIQKEKKYLSLFEAEVLHINYLFVSKRKDEEPMFKSLFLLTENFLFFISKDFKREDGKVHFTHYGKIELQWMQSFFYEDDKDSPKNPKYMFYLLKKKKKVIFRVLDKQDYEKWKSLCSTLTINRNMFNEFIVEKPLGEHLNYKSYKLRNAFTQEEYSCRRYNKKELDKEKLGFLVDEIKILRSLRKHPNIIELNFIFESHNSVYMITELIEGRRCFKRKRKYKEEAVFFVMKSVLEALKYMETKGIVHRNIKPSNILLKYKKKSIKENQIKVCGFQLAYYKEEQTIIRSGNTYGYMAPESIDNINYIPDHKYDIFSLGVVLYNALTKTRLFERKFVADMLANNKSADINFEHVLFKGIGKKGKLTSPGEYKGHVINRQDKKTHSFFPSKKLRRNKDKYRKDRKQSKSTFTRKKI